MSENPYQAEELEPLTESRRPRKPNAFQRTFSAIFLFLGSCVAVIAAAVLLYDTVQDGALRFFDDALHELAIAGTLLGLGMISVGMWVRRWTW